MNTELGFTEKSPNYRWQKKSTMKKEGGILSYNWVSLAHLILYLQYLPKNYYCYNSFSLVVRRLLIEKHENPNYTELLSDFLCHLFVEMISQF